MGGRTKSLHKRFSSPLQYVTTATHGNASTRLCGHYVDRFASGWPSSVAHRNNGCNFLHTRGTSETGSHRLDEDGR
jgi:hypothetical protein